MRISFNGVMKGGGQVDGSAHVGTAGAILDFSSAAGLEPMLSSFSRRVFSWEMIRRVAMMRMGWVGGVG